MADPSYLVAFFGGLVSFLSPCVLPVVPVYLSMVTGLEVSEIKEGARRHMLRITRDTGLFIGGFTFVFVLLGLSATAIGRALFDSQTTLTRVSGAVVIAMAALILVSAFRRVPFLGRERRFHPDVSRFGPFAAPVAGAAFGLGWTPCIGPVLTGILAIAGPQGEIARGATLLATYSAGLGASFLATGLAFSRLTSVFGWVKRHYTAVTASSALVLGFFGVLLLNNNLVWLIARMNNLMSLVGLERLVNAG